MQVMNTEQGKESSTSMTIFSSELHTEHEEHKKNV